MEIRPLHNDQDYRAALKAVATIYLNPARFVDTMENAQDRYGVNTENAPNVESFTVQDLVDYIKTKRPAAGGEKDFNTVLNGINSQFKASINSQTAKKS